MSKHRTKIHQLIERVNRLCPTEGMLNYDESFFDKYPQFINIRFILVNRRDITGTDAIKRYVRFMKFLDSGTIEQNRDYVIESFKFIKTYCDTQKITTEQYADHIEKGRVTEAFWIHLKDRAISAYALTFFPKTTQKILTCDQDEYRYYLEDVSDYTKKLTEVSSNPNIKQQLINIKQQLHNP